MKPIPFEHQTHVLNKPKNMTDDQCSSLPVFQINDSYISCWKPSMKDRLRIFLTGRIWLVLSGATHPLVYILSYRPFSKLQADQVHDEIKQKSDFSRYMLSKYGEMAMERAKSLNASGVPLDDLRRYFVVEENDLIDAEKFGMSLLFGLKLKV